MERLFAVDSVDLIACNPDNEWARDNRYKELCQNITGSFRSMKLQSKQNREISNVVRV